MSIRLRQSSRAEASSRSAGRSRACEASFLGLGWGLVFAVLLVYFLMVVNFQSWLDPLIIMMALPATLAGILWMLFVTQTTISVPSLMGAIMSIGVATANSILLVTFANDQRLAGENAREAALQAGYTRLRPVMMTALAMIIGMLPMSLGPGRRRRAERAAWPRRDRRSCIVATAATLFFVPVIYSMMRKKQPMPIDREEIVRICTRILTAKNRIAPSRPRTTRRFGLLALVLAIVLIGLFAAGYLPRRKRQADLAARAPSPPRGTGM